MVAPSSCPGVTVEILVDGQPLAEYDDIDAAPASLNTVTEYIEARSDVEFAVRVRFTADFLFPAANMEMRTVIDGVPRERSLLYGNTLSSSSGTTIKGCSVQISPETEAVQNFRFTALDIG
jgi:hypothetical protein